MRGTKTVRQKKQQLEVHEGGIKGVKKNGLQESSRTSNPKGNTKN